MSFGRSRDIKAIFLVALFSGLVGVIVFESALGRVASSAVAFFGFIGLFFPLLIAILGFCIEFMLGSIERIRGRRG